MPLVTLLIFAEIVREKHPKVACGPQAERRSVFLGPHFQVSYSHPTQELPARQILAHKVSVKHTEWSYEKSESDAYQEKEKGKDLPPLTQLLIILLVPQVYLKAHS